MKVLRETQFAGLTPAARGKVRDIYDLGDKLLIVATDRLSAFDVILPTRISLRPLAGLTTNSQAAQWSCERPGPCRLNASYAATSPARDGRTIGPPEKSVALRCLRACANQTACRSPSLRPQRKPRRGTTKTFLSNGRHRSLARNLPKESAPSAWKSTVALRLMLNRAGSSLPTRNSNSACSTMN